MTLTGPDFLKIRGLIQFGLALQELPYVSAKRFGVVSKNDMIHDMAVRNSRSLRSAMETAAAERKILHLDFGHALFAEPMFLKNVDTLTMVGYGQSDDPNTGTVLEWVGPSFQSGRYGSEEKVPSSMFHFENCRNFQLSDFTVVATHPLGRVFRSSTIRNTTLPPAELRFRNITCDGVNGAILLGALFDDPLGGDANNDFSVWEHCRMTNYGVGQAHGNIYGDYQCGGWHFDHAMSMSHSFFHCEASQTGHNPVWEGQIIGVRCHSFSWYGGFMARNRWCFEQTRPQDPITISGPLHCESNRGLFLGGRNRLSTAPVTIQGVRWANNKMRDGDVFVDYQGPGPLIMEGCQQDGVYGVASIPVKFGPKNHLEHETASSCRIAHNTFRSSTPPKECIQFPNKSTSSTDVDGFVPDIDIFGNTVEDGGDDEIIHVRRIPNG